jgi:hypothetical protein
MKKPFFIQGNFFLCCGFSFVSHTGTESSLLMLALQMRHSLEVFNPSDVEIRLTVVMYHIISTSLRPYIAANSAATIWYYITVFERKIPKALKTTGWGLLNPVSEAPPWLPWYFALSANQRRDLPMKKSWPSKMRNKTACFGWYGRAVSIWIDRPKAKLSQLASGQNPSALH